MTDSQNSAAHKKVILIHGMWMNTLSMRFIGGQLTKKGWQVIYYNYSSMFETFDKNVEGLYQLWQKHQSPQTHLVAHSLGGLLILAMMKKYQLKNLPRTVLLSSPVKGSAVAKKMMASSIGRFFLGKSLQALVTGEQYTAENKIGIILGSRGIGIGHLIQKLPGPHDGVVAAEEASLENAEDKVILPVTHATMLVSSKVVAAIDGYLKSGRF